MGINAGVASITWSPTWWYSCTSLLAFSRFLIHLFCSVIVSWSEPNLPQSGLGGAYLYHTLVVQERPGVLYGVGFSLRMLLLIGTHPMGSFCPVCNLQACRYKVHYQSPDVLFQLHHFFADYTPLKFSSFQAIVGYLLCEVVLKCELLSTSTSIG